MKRFEKIIFLCLIASITLKGNNYIIYEKELDKNNSHPYNKITINYLTEKGEKNLSYFITTDYKRIYTN